MFLSLNMDENPGLIGSVVLEQKLTFPVLPAYSYASQTLKIEVVPENWVVGPDGVVRLKGTGSYGPAEEWETGMKEAIEKVRSSGAGAGFR